MSLHRETRAARITAPREVDGTPVGVPIHQSSIFAFDGPEALASALAGPEGAFAYSGYANPTVRALEEAVADLEGGAAALATASGMGATSSVLQSLLRAGDHVIAQKALFGGTMGALRDLAERWGVTVEFVRGDDPAELRAAIRPTSRLLYLETIANPTGFVPDLPAMVDVARSAGLATVVDNTFATPLLCRPIEHGADVVIHSATKYLGGHHDVVGGVAVFADAERYRAAWSQATRLGVVADPFSAWLVIRGVKTLPLRLRQQCANALHVAERLATHPAVAAVHYPGLPSHPSHAVARRFLSGYGGVLAVDLAGGADAAQAFLRRLRLVLNAGSLGGTETVASHPATSTHRHLDDDQLREAGVSRGMVRIAFGIEHPDDLWGDIEHALSEVDHHSP
ncbi:methionine-gamma-lyase [Streptoalloteichus tenebrarius]|uniref:Methionine-gamma-lyase n=1 Tax=Streptoalloteichus tenebrarius (strain ATCC 17920 / DSM 40477 / JCM 4838 / CBS 697.72 / NBRC 16177 / NCIMB 11028 / NRRL B-12390 / A12253. 1 / ISP 5477) TaxID=1933 RepID=A0ABT1HLM7_STRSD|nr:aminotransferase class I/II-fold pyridoxal phosphate-dependent enzyme [Streptoalloteichus tenebrarius]MCP2256403.1 methionine-gamma-lyase [Streptoalloteichus tenebrarius]BFF04751.1 PLP-dependent aspartate aminotransferase family protein [Streptoalloteichus tenebrarius]